MKSPGGLLHALTTVSLLRWATVRTESPLLDLTGKMLTLTTSGVTFSASPFPSSSTYSPSSSPSPWWTATTPPSSSPYPPSSSPWWTATTPPSSSPYPPSSSPWWRKTVYPSFSPYPWWTSTTPTPPNPSVTVCLRFFTEGAVRLALGSVSMQFNGRQTSLQIGYNTLGFTSNRFFWPSIREPRPWTSTCMVLDAKKGVAQVFLGGTLSARRLFSDWYRWSIDGGLSVSGFEGQLTDVQVWDYPLSYRTIRDYMSNARFPSGTILTWSQISFNPGGRVLLEDSYDNMEFRPIQKKDENPGPMKKSWQRRLNKKYKKGKGNELKEQNWERGRM